MKVGAQYSTLTARPGLIDEMNAHVTSGDAEMRRAAESVLSVLAPDDLLSGIMATPGMDRWKRLEACEAISRSRTPVYCQRLVNDPRSGEGMVVAAREVLRAIEERSSALRASSPHTTPPDQLLRPAGPAAATPPDELLRASASQAPPDDDTELPVTADDMPQRGWRNLLKRRR